MNSPNSLVIAIIQARTGSTRLPAKVLKDLAGKTMLEHVVRRTTRAKTIDDVIVATTEREDDQSLVDLCKSRNWLYFKGSEDDVLDRYYRAASFFRADIIVRITSDCPLIEPEIIDKVVSDYLFIAPRADYVSNTIIRTYPLGLNVEVLSYEALENAWQEDNNPSWREHVTPYIYRNPNRFRIRNVVNEVDYSHMRWTVDTSEDLLLVRKIFDNFEDDAFSWRDVLELLRVHPEWLEINRSVIQKEVP